MKKEINTSWKNRIFKRLGLVLSLGTIAFVFQACYGVPTDKEFQEELISGKIVDENGNPLSGIEVSLDSIYSTITNEEGKFHSFIPIQDKHNISIKNKLDTTVSAKDATDLLLVVKSK